MSKKEWRAKFNQLKTEVATLLEGAGWIFNIKIVTKLNSIFIWCNKCEKLDYEVLFGESGVSTINTKKKNEVFNVGMNVAGREAGENHLTSEDSLRQQLVKCNDIKKWLSHQEISSIETTTCG